MKPKSPRNDHLLLRQISPILVIVGVLALGGVLYYAYYATILAESEAVAAETVAAADSVFEAVPALTSNELQQLRRYRNADHVEKAESLGVDVLRDRDDARRLTSDSTLVPLTDSRYYEVAAMDYSVPYVTPHTANLLEVIGMRFHGALREEGLPPFRFVITSATRTEADQRRLRQVNVNAAQKSSHTYGTTVDLHYARFTYAPEADSLGHLRGVFQSVVEERLMLGYAALAERHDERLKALLGRVLDDLQERGQVYVIHEQRQPVYHITVAAPVPDPSPETPVGPPPPGPDAAPRIDGTLGDDLARR